MNQKQCAVLGLGAMGSRVAQRLLLAGHDVTVWNRSPDSAARLGGQARIAHTPRQAAASAEFVISMVTNDHASREIWTAAETGALAGMRAGSVAIEQSTVTPAWAVELATLARAHHAFCIDAPVVGSRPQAEAGQLVHLVGGTDELVTRASPVLAAMGSALHHMGPNGAGATMKLLVNALFGIQVAALGELMAVATRSDLGAQPLLQVLRELATTSPALKGAIGLILARNFEPLFPLDLVEKDLQYAVAHATRVGAPLPLTQVVLNDVTRACAQGYDAENITALVKLFE